MGLRGSPRPCWAGASLFPQLVGRALRLAPAPGARAAPQNAMPRDMHWVERARVWRCILLQRPDGCWDMTPGLALVFLAHGADSDSDGADGEGVEAGAAAAAAGDQDLLRGEPLNFSLEEALRAMPAELREACSAAASAGGPPCASPERLWATLLVRNVLEMRRFSWCAPTAPTAARSRRAPAGRSWIAALLCRAPVPCACALRLCLAPVPCVCGWWRRHGTCHAAQAGCASFGKPPALQLRLFRRARGLQWLPRAPLHSSALRRGLPLAAAASAAV